MRTLRLAIWTATVALSCSLAAAQGGGKRADPNAMDKFVSPFIGEIVNMAGNTISVRGVPTLEKPPADSENQLGKQDAKRTLHFLIKPDTKLLKNGQPAKIADLHERDTVQVSFTSKEGSSLRRVTEIQMGKFAATAEDKPDDNPKQEPEKKGKGKKHQKE
jgi:hypothetical protein